MVKTLLLFFAASAICFAGMVTGIINFPMAIIAITAIGILTMRRTFRIIND